MTTELEQRKKDELQSLVDRLVAATYKEVTYERVHRMLLGAKGRPCYFSLYETDEVNVTELAVAIRVDGRVSVHVNSITNSAGYHWSIFSCGAGWTLEVVEKPKSTTVPPQTQ